MSVSLCLSKVVGGGSSPNTMKYDVFDPGPNTMNTYLPCRVTNRVQTLCDNERHGVQAAGYVIGVVTLNPAVVSTGSRRRRCIWCGLWCGGGTRWVSEGLAVLVVFCDLWVFGVFEVFGVFAV